MLHDSILYCFFVLVEILYLFQGHFMLSQKTQPENNLGNLSYVLKVIYYM